MIDLRGLEIKENNLTIFNSDITGRVTSVNYSPTLKKIIGLAMVDIPFHQNESVQIRLDDGSTLDALVVPSRNYDPKNEKAKYMSKLNGDFHSVSPLRTFFDGNLVEAKIFQSCQISALKETINATPEASYIFDLSCLQKLIIIGKEASLVTKITSNLKN